MWLVILKAIALLAKLIIRQQLYRNVVLQIVIAFLATSQPKYNVKHVQLEDFFFSPRVRLAQLIV